VRVRRTVTPLLVLALCALLGACGSSSPSARSPKAVLASIVAAAVAQKSAHWTEVVSPHMQYSTVWSSDVTADSGTQRITFEAWKPRDVGRARVLLVNNTVYVNGNPRGLQGTLSLTEAQAQKYADRWISIPKGDKLYARMAADLTIASVVRDVTTRGAQGGWKLKSGTTGPLGPTGTEGPTGHSGASEPMHSYAPVLLVEWGKYGPSLTARRSGEPLPIDYSSGICIGCSDSVRFSRWNDSVSIDVPARSTPIATVRRG
jgi:hypothetical protein